MRHNINEELMNNTEKENISLLELYDLNKVDDLDKQKDIFSFRYEKLLSSRIVDPNPEHTVVDQFDNVSNSGQYTLTNKDKTIIGAIRPVLRLPEISEHETPAYYTHNKLIDDVLGKNTSFVESSRFVADQKKNNGVSNIDLIFILFRSVAANAIIHRVDYVITTVNKRHVKFYESLMGFESISDDLPSFGSNLTGVLIAAKFSKFSEVAKEIPLLNISIEEAQRIAIKL